MPRTMKLPTVMGPQHRFSMVPQATIERSVFDRSHGHKTTFIAGQLVPVLVDEVLPGDTFHLSMAALVRLTTPIKPVMDNMYLDSFFFFVPYRLIWDNFQKFMGEQLNPGDSTSFTVPVLAPAYTPTIGSIFDYMGVMPQSTNAQVQTGQNVSALPFRAYNLIWREWFRDENLIASTAFPVLKGDGPDSTTNYGVARRGKRHDYFTSCLPFLQKGTAQSVLLTGQATVKTVVTDAFTGAQEPLHMLDSVAGGAPAQDKALSIGASNKVEVSGTTTTSAAGRVYPSNLIADLSSVASPVTINALRQSFQIQKLLERDARGGTRYTEKVRAHFGVSSPDARLQRPEYLGGGSSPIIISPIAQNTQTGIAGGSTPLGNLAGYGTAMVTGGHGFVKSFTEHGVLLGIVNVRADLTYQQGLERQWSRQTIYDFYWPALAHIGEQAVLNQEIFWGATSALLAQDQSVFGYQERYAEYRYKPSRISGQMRSNAATPLDIWHLSEKFGSLPTLAQTFIEDQTHGVLQRILAVPSEPDFYGDFWFRFKCARPMPVYGVPGLIDHF